MPNLPISVSNTFKDVPSPIAHTIFSAKVGTSLRHFPNITPFLSMTKLVFHKVPMLVDVFSFTPMTTYVLAVLAARHSSSVALLGISTDSLNRRRNQAMFAYGKSIQIQYGYPGTNTSGKATNLAPFLPASRIRRHAFSIVASRFRNTGAVCTTAALNLGYVSGIRWTPSKTTFVTLYSSSDQLQPTYRFKPAGCLGKRFRFYGCWTHYATLSSPASSRCASPAFYLTSMKSAATGGQVKNSR